MAEELTEEWFDWLIDQLGDWLTDIPIAWLIDWPIDWSMINQNCDMKLKSKREQFPSSQIRTSDLRMSPETSTVLRSTNWAIEGIDVLCSSKNQFVDGAFCQLADVEVATGVILRK